MNKKQVRDVISEKKLGFLNEKDKKMMLMNLRDLKISVDKLEMMLLDEKITPEKKLWIVQYIANTRKRTLNIIWILTGEHLEIKDEESILLK